MTRHAVRRILDVRARSQAKVWAARAAVIRAQLVAQRQTYA
jgi:hypothetical protein